MGDSQSVYIYPNHEQIQKVSCFPTSDFNQNLYMHTSFKTDVGIDESLLRYSGTDSTAQLQQYSSGLLTNLGSNLPNYIEKVGEGLGGLTYVPNAVGIGALAISMILQFCFSDAKGSSSKDSDTGNLLRRIFAEEKSSEMRALMNNYLTRYNGYLKDDRKLLEETTRLEQQLSLQLNRLKDSMLSGHMNDHALKHWTNGAAFHTQTLIHIARLKNKGTSDFESAKNSLQATIFIYNRELSELIEKFKTYKASEIVNTKNPIYVEWLYLCCTRKKCCESKCELPNHPDDSLAIPEFFLGEMFSVNSQIVQLKKYFADLQNNYNTLINQHGTFQVPKQ